MGFGTRAIHAGYEKMNMVHSLTPIYQTSTFMFESAEQGGKGSPLKKKDIYSRLGNPTNAQLEAKLANLENAEAAVSTASGIGAITSALWVSLSAGDHVVAAKTLYGCTFAFLNHGLTNYGVEVTFVILQT